jgi:hypothetical protein
VNLPREQSLPQQQPLEGIHIILMSLGADGNPGTTLMSISMSLH